MKMCSVLGVFFSMVYSCWDVFFAHKLLHQEWMLISVSYPVGLQPKSLQSVTPASMFFSLVAWKLQVFKQPRLWPTVSEITPKKYCSMFKFICYTLLSCRKLLSSWIKGSHVNCWCCSQQMENEEYCFHTYVPTLKCMQQRNPSHFWAPGFPLMSDTELDWDVYQNCLSAWHLDLEAAPYFE